MKEKKGNKPFGSIFTKTERASELYKPNKPSKEALICLECNVKNCKGNCDRYKEEMNKIRGNKGV